MAPAESDGLVEILHRAIAEGGTASRKEAFEILADRLKGAPEFETEVLEAAWKDPVPEVRAAAVLAARYYSSEAALAAILEALKTDDARREATRSLRVSSRPGLARRLLAELDEALGAGDPEWSRAILRALTCHADPDVQRKAVTLLDSHGREAAELVAASDDPDALRALAGRVDAKDPRVMAKAVEAAFKLGADEAYDRLAPILVGKDRPTSEAVARAREVLSEARRSSDPRWPALILEIVEARAGLGMGERVKALLGGAELKHGFPVEHLLSALPELDGAEARRLWTILERGGRLETYGLVLAIARIEGPPAWLPLLKRALPWLDASLANLFGQLAGEPARVVDVRGLLASLPPDDGSRRNLEKLLALLERKFLGR
ncbi:MAG TPA: hypothetical protein VF950_03350 [Planctomycetota bacterium]